MHILPWRDGGCVAGNGRAITSPKAVFVGGWTGSALLSIALINPVSNVERG